MMAAFIRGSSVGQVLFNKFSCFQLKRGNMKNWYDILLDHCNELMSVIDKAYRGRPAVCLAFNVITIDSSSLHSKLQRISRDCKTNNVEDLLSVSKPQILYNCSHPILFCYDFVYIYSVCLMFFQSDPWQNETKFFPRKKSRMTKTTRACDDILLVSCVFCINLCPCLWKYLKNVLEYILRCILKLS